MGLLARKEGDGQQTMTPEWLHFGDKKIQGNTKQAGSAVLGGLSTRQPVMISSKSYLAVLTPTVPVPVAGGVLYLPHEWVEPANIGMEAVTSI